MSELNGVFFDETKLVDLSWDSFCYLLKNTFQDDLEGFM